MNGYTFVDRLSIDAYYEGEAEEFEHVVEEYKRRSGYYPERILEDKNKNPYLHSVAEEKCIRDIFKEACINMKNI